MRFLILVLLSFSCLFLFTCCSYERLHVENRYISVEQLASSYVNTPDYRQCNPTIGQQLEISWSLDQEIDQSSNARLSYIVRFRDLTEQNEVIPIYKRRGRHIYYLINDEYLSKGGILTYKAELWVGDELIDTWKQMLWVELITFDHSGEE